MTVPTLARIEADGWSDVRVTGLDERELSIYANAWAEVSVSGRADRVRVTAAAWSDVDLDGLDAATVEQGETEPSWAGL